MNKIRKRCVICIALITLILTGCSIGNDRLSEAFDKESLKQSAEKVIQSVNENDYDSFVENADSTFMSAITEEVFVAQVVGYIKQKGKFVSFGNEVVVGQKDDKTGVEYGVAVIVAEYEEEQAQFTVSFTQEMKLAGIWVK